MALFNNFKTIGKFTLILLLSSTNILISCKDEEEINIDFRNEMREFVISISEYAKTEKPNFIIITQNGQELITENGESDGILMTEYLAAIDGVGREDLFYGYQKDDKATPENEQVYMVAFCDLFLENDKSILVTDYCNTQSKVDDSYVKNYELNYISFSASERNLNVIPDYPTHPFHENLYSIKHLNDAQNFLYLINSEKYETKADFISALSNTNYDVLIIDLFHNEFPFSGSEIELLKSKQNGTHRIVICYMSIGEAEDYRFYWDGSWEDNSPKWLAQENPNWEGNFKVKYWDKEWQEIILGSSESYLDKIIDAGFDGVYLDIIDAFEYFEN